MHHQDQPTARASRENRAAAARDYARIDLVTLDQEDAAREREEAALLRAVAARKEQRADALERRAQLARMLGLIEAGQVATA